MKLCFITNYLTHHQLPFCEELYRRLGAEFCLLVTTPMDAERVRMGWEIDTRDNAFVIHYDDDYALSHRLVRESEVLICGGTHVSYIEERLALGRLTFRYFERLYKRGRWRAFTPRGYFGKLKEHTRYKNAPVYLLCAGAYVPADFALFGAYPKKMLRWGYFPAFYPHTEEALRRPAREKLKLLWTGRMIDWKHAADAVYAAERLKKAGISFQLTMIGEGEERERIAALITARELEEEIALLPFQTPEKIRMRMAESDIYLMTSDYQEGWGAVVNEAMNEGCAVVASSGAGSVPYLIRQEENALVYPCGDRETLVQELLRLCRDDALRHRLGQQAYRTIAEQWNASVAAERFLDFARRALAGEARMDVYPEGPMSAAPRIAPSQGYAYCCRTTEAITCA